MLTIPDCFTYASAAASRTVLLPSNAFYRPWKQQHQATGMNLRLVVYHWELFFIVILNSMALLFQNLRARTGIQQLIWQKGSFANFRKQLSAQKLDETEECRQRRYAASVPERYSRQCCIHRVMTRHNQHGIRSYKQTSRGDRHVNSSLSKTSHAHVSI